MINKKNIDIVSIATPCSFDDNEFIKKMLIAKDFTPFFHNQINVSFNNSDNNYFASCSPKERFLHFQKACENMATKIIWCNRGGYGSADILPFLYQMAKPQTKKILIGFSDISSIATYVQQQWGWQVICAPMLYQIINNKVSPSSQQMIFDLIAGKIRELNYDLTLLKRGAVNEITGKIVGGCVSVLAGNYATKNQLKWHNKILFLEDEGEDGERLDRYLTQIAFMINEKKSHPSAILLGNFFENNDFGKVNKEKINYAIKKFCDKITNIPIWQENSFSLGHSYHQKPLILGVVSKINVNNKLQQKINLNFFNKVAKN